VQIRLLTSISIYGNRLGKLLKRTTFGAYKKAVQDYFKQEKTISKQERKTSVLEEKASKLEEKNTELDRLVKLLQRMKFVQSRERFEDPNQTQLPLDIQEIQKLYAVERKAKEQNLTPQQIKELRLEQSLSIINELGKYMFAQMKLVLPKSQIAKAFAYSQTRWDNLSVYLYDGNLQIDNNLVKM